MITALLVSTAAFAENGRATFKYEYEQAREVKRCAISADYCQLKQELKNLYVEQQRDFIQLRNIKYTLSKACENSQIRKSERASFDPIANRFPIKTSCDKIPEYQKALESSKAMASYLKQRLQTVSDRIVQVEIETSDLAAQID